MKLAGLVLVVLFSGGLRAAAPVRYLELLPYVQPAPDQGRTGTCLYVASTGAMELLANRKHDLRNPEPYGRFDLSESFLIAQRPHEDGRGKLFLERPVYRFNWGFGISTRDWDFDVWRGSVPDRTVWEPRDWGPMEKVELPKVTTVPLFAEGDRWSTNVLSDAHVQAVKAALIEHRAPVLVNYNDNNFWHVILIVGYDDLVPGKCYQITDQECGPRRGAFYVRDSFGLSLELRDYDWFRVKGNHAVVVKEVE